MDRRSFLTGFAATAFGAGTAKAQSARDVGRMIERGADYYGDRKETLYRMKPAYEQKWKILLPKRKRE